MTRSKNIILVLLSFFIFLSCENNEEIIIDSDNLLIGNWANAVYDSEEITFSRKAALPNTTYGVSFNKNGVFKERTSGFCGTPPLTFFTVEGNWQKEETLIKVQTSESYSAEFNWRIVSLTENNLTIKRELTEQQQDHHDLMELYYDFSEIAYSLECKNENDWSFVAYGSKACGGPQGFIPYNKNIDTTSFLAKVEKYNEKENAYNLKWGIISTCDVIAQPKTVICENKVPVLKY